MKSTYNYNQSIQWFDLLNYIQLTYLKAPNLPWKEQEQTNNINVKGNFQIIYRDL